MQHADDRDDIRASRNGDAHAFRRIVERHQQKLARRMRRFARGQPDIEELVQQTFVEAYFSLATYSAAAPLEHWLNRIATRVGYRYWKQLARQPTEPLDARHLAAADKGDPAAADDLLQFLMNQLSPRDRLVLTLLHLDEHSVQEAANLTGWSQTMVKVQAFRARARLRKILAKQGITELES